MASVLRGAFCRLLSLFNLTSRPTLTMHAEPTTLSTLDAKTGNQVLTRLDTIIKRCKSLNDYYTPTPWLVRYVAVRVFAVR